MAQSAMSSGGPAMAAVAIAAGPHVNPSAIAGMGCSLALLTQCLLASTTAGRRGGHKTRTLSPPECLTEILLLLLSSDDVGDGDEDMGDSCGVYLNWSGLAFGGVPG